MKASCPMARKKNDTSTAEHLAQQERQRAYVRDVLTAMNTDPTNLARLSETDPATLTRFMNRPDWPSLLSSRTIQKIVDASGIAPPTGMFAAPATRQTGFRAIETSAYNHEHDEIGAAIEAMKGGRNAIEPMTLRSSALDAIGYRPGDIMLVDMNLTAPRDGDIVCAQFARASGEVETVFRLYRDGWLVGTSSDPAALIPRNSRDPSVNIMGIVTASLRRRGAPMT